MTSVRRLLLVALSLTMIVTAGLTEDYETKDLKAALEVKTFEAIASFIIKNGDRQTYCNRYNNNPHYEIGEVDIYLDPISQKTNFLKSDLSNNVADYNRIVIYDRNKNAYYDFYPFIVTYVGNDSVLNEYITLLK
ncbi:MAG: hypothetical protein LBQ52_06900, partial [Helicobacteraceae bacterium]|nr:hypothetical protein [Helicobacteraceae bacterium]